jgi:hypothetical protein
MEVNNMKIMRNLVGIIILGTMLMLMGCNTHGFIEDGGTEPQNKIQECFDTYEELEAYFVKDEDGTAPAMEEMSLHGERWEEYVSNVLAGENGVLKPYWADERMKLRESKDFLQIDIGCMDGGRPWLWYFCEMQDVEWSIQLKILSKDEISRLENQPIGDVLKSTIFGGEYDDCIQLRDKEVMACITKPDNDTRMHIKFVYDNVFVSIHVNEKVFYEVDWSNFSLRTE